MKTRIITAIIAIALLVPICYFSNYIVFPLMISVLSIIGVYEMAKCLKREKDFALCIPMYIIAGFLPVCDYIIMMRGKGNRTFFACALVALFFMLIYSLAYVMFRKNKDNLSDILTFYAMFSYIVGCFSSICVVRYMYGGKYLYLIIFLSAWICDTFAYFTGKFIGKHDLIPEISPKKTIEGSVGGIIFTIIGLCVYNLVAYKVWGSNFSYVKIIIVAIVLSVVSQIGDLIASAVKRQYVLKDYGNIFVGHGGVLDRFDSVMLVAPTFYILIVILRMF